MKVDHKLIDKLAELSQLEFDDASKNEMIKDLDKILAFVNKLDELDTKNIKPLIYINDEVNSLREDEVGQHLNKNAALKNAPEKNSDYFKVPKVLNK